VLLGILPDEGSHLEKYHLYIFLMTGVIVLDVVTMMDCYVLVVVSDEKRINGGAPELVVLGLLQSQIVKDLQWLPNVWLLWL